jgi:peptidyl-prolyl cis-trans isomerase B (cyclophilin B)
MTVRVPDGSTDEVRLDLFGPRNADGTGSQEPLQSVPALAGDVDLAALFPAIWTQASPSVRYVQLVVNDRDVGPPVVLQPMVNVPRATLISTQSGAAYFVDPKTGQSNYPEREGQVVWSVPAPTYTGVRAYVDQHVTMETSLGRLEFRLRADVAPNTVWNFRELVQGGYYSGTIVHRIAAKLATGDGFVIQFGDPTGTGTGGPGYTIPLEQSSLEHDFGVLSMARSAEPDSGGGQVFLCLSREGTRSLDGQYTSFAQLLVGAEVVELMSKLPVKGDRPETPPVITSAALIDAPGMRRGVNLAKKPEKPAVKPR